MTSASLKPVISELESLFSTFNKAFFESKLDKPVITVSPDSTKGAYGWCTGWKAWQNGTENGGFYEINLCAEYLNRPFEETCSTLIHEMVHLWNLQEGVQDTSRSGTPQPEVQDSGGSCLTMYFSPNTFERDYSAEQFDKKEAAADARKKWVQEVGREQAHKLVDLYWGSW